MNLPNKLTVMRMAMIPAFLVFFYARSIPWNFLWALLTFAAASLTDLLDGKIARKYNLVSDFGKLMDPLADKLLVTAAFCCILPMFATWGTVSLILILSREFLVTSVRLIAAGKGEVLAADIWGKVKTVAQMVWLCAMLAIYALPLPYRLDMVILYAMSYPLLAAVVLLTVLSGAHYIIKNRKLFADA